MDIRQMFSFNRFWHEQEGKSTQLDKDTFIWDVLLLIVLNLKQEAPGTENMTYVQQSCSHVHGQLIFNLVCSVVPSYIGVSN